MKLFNALTTVLYVTVTVLYAWQGKAVIAGIWGFSSGIWFARSLRDALDWLDER